MGNINAARSEGFDEGLDFENICQGPLPDSALKGIKLFNERLYWEAHEALERAWLEESGAARHLYKGVLQAGVMYLQIQRENFIGMAKMYERASRWLSPWPEFCRGIHVGKLRRDIEIAIKSAGQLGPDKLGEFDQSLFKILEMEKS